MPPAWCARARASRCSAPWSSLPWPAFSSAGDYSVRRRQAAARSGTNRAACAFSRWSICGSLRSIMLPHRLWILRDFVGSERHGCASFDVAGSGIGRRRRTWTVDRTQGPGARRRGGAHGGERVEERRLAHGRAARPGSARRQAQRRRRRRQAPRPRRAQAPDAKIGGEESRFRYALERDDFSSNRHLALSYAWSMIFSENRYPLFGIML